MAMNRPSLRRSSDDAAVVQTSRPIPRPDCFDHACCCSALPVVEALMPATDERPRPVELLLCGHHYRLSRDALELAGAHIFRLNNQVDTYLSPPDEAAATPRI